MPKGEVTPAPNPPGYDHTPEPIKRPCRRCHWQSAIRHGKCWPCYLWHRRHGTERPEELIRKHHDEVMRRHQH